MKNTTSFRLDGELICYIAVNNTQWDEFIQQLVDTLGNDIKWGTTGKKVGEYNPLTTTPFDEIYIGFHKYDNDVIKLYWTDWSYYYELLQTPLLNINDAVSLAKQHITGTVPKPDLSKYPHVCPRCGAPAYIGAMNNIDCSNGCC